MTKKLGYITALVLGAISLISQITFAAPVNTNKPTKSTLSITKSTSVTPIRKTKVYFNREFISQKTQGNFTIVGLNPENKIEFNVRKNELVTQAQLNLQFTPSPSLIPVQSQLKVYLNEELMGVISITQDMLGKSNQIQLPIDPRFISDFNRLRLQFIGHYNAVCENPANSTLWVEISKSSFIDLTIQTLELKNDLSHFPEPFFDRLDDRRLKLPIVFSEPPNLVQQRAAAILASWFGVQAQWRGQSFPALFNQLPENNAIVFLTNQQRPDSLKNYRTVNAPTIEMINHPDNPYIKLLVISGRNDNDLITAVTGIARGNILFRGQSVAVDKVETIAPRQPYDAPYWIQTNRPTTFEELQQYKEQLQATGFTLNPIKLPFKLPPDLFLNKSPGIKVVLKYRYSTPPPLGTSHLNVSLNNYFIQGFKLEGAPTPGSKLFGVLPLKGMVDSVKKFTIPVLDLGSQNEMVFEFAYTNSIGGGTTDGRCESFILINNEAAIDGSSTIDFTNYRHYIKMPNLGAFANAGFPFSRLADLSQTWVLVSKQPQVLGITTLLNTIGNIGAQTGYPALALNVTDDWSKLKNKDADILIIGTFPGQLYDESKINLLMSKTESWINSPFRQQKLPNLPIEAKNASVNNKTVVRSNGVMAAIVGLQSPYYKQRSIVGLLADTQRGYELLNETLSVKTLLGQVYGSVAIIRESGINSLQVGSIYYVGHLPWYVQIWFVLQQHPINMALAVLLVTLILTFILWRLLKSISRRRLNRMDD